MGNHGSKFGIIMETVEDLAKAFLTTDRKEDAELPLGSIEQAIRDGDVTISEIVNHFDGTLHRDIAIPVDEDGAYTGQAARAVRNEHIHAEIAQLQE